MKVHFCLIAMAVCIGLHSGNFVACDPGKTAGKGISEADGESLVAQTTTETQHKTQDTAFVGEQTHGTAQGVGQPRFSSHLPNKSSDFASGSTFGKSKSRPIYKKLPVVGGTIATVVAGTAVAAAALWLRKPYDPLSKAAKIKMTEVFLPACVPKLCDYIATDDDKQFFVPGFERHANESWQKAPPSALNIVLSEKFRMVDKRPRENDVVWITSNAFGDDTISMSPALGMERCGEIFNDVVSRLKEGKTIFVDQSLMPERDTTTNQFSFGQGAEYSQDVYRLLHGIGRAAATMQKQESSKKKKPV